MKKILYLYGLWFLTACNPNSLAPEPPTVKAHINRLPKPLDISFLNKDKKGFLNLSNEILFHGFSESGLFKNDTSSKDTKTPSDNSPPKMKISSICTVANKGKFTKEILLTRYHFDFSVMDLIPHALFFQKQSLSSSCSFFFMVIDTQGTEYHFALTQFPMESIPENKNLFIINSTGEALDLLRDKTVTWEDLDEFFLISEKPQTQQTLAFFCNQLSEVIEIKDHPATPVFRLLYTTQNPLPDGIQNCRILARRDNKSIGITKVFKIDFSSFTHQTPRIKLKELNLYLNLLPPEPLFQPGKWHHLINTDRKKKIIKHTKEDIKPDYETPHINAILEVEGLPENFHLIKYSPVKIKVETKCIGEIFPDKSITQTFDFNLTPYIPLMSITPLEVFQMSYPKNDRLPKATSNSPTVKIWAAGYEKHQDYPTKVNIKPPVKCSYTFHLQELKTEAKLSFPLLTYSIQWNSGGIGVIYDHRDLRRGIPVFYEDLLYEGAGHILFPFKTQNKLYSPYIQSHLKPTAMILKCGYGLKKNQKAPAYSHELSLEYAPISIPLSEFISNSIFKEYVENQKTIKCRALLYQKDRLLYFSPEIQILSKTDRLIRTLRLRGIMYERSLDKSFIWNDIKTFFFTL